MIVSTLVGEANGRRTVTVPTGVIDDFERDDGWPGDRPATCGNIWEGTPDTNPSYLLGGTWQGTPPGGFDSGGAIYLGTGEHNIQFDITNAPSTYGSGNNWLVQLLRDTGDGSSNLQLSVSQSNSFLVNYPARSTTPTIYASGAGMPYGATWRWYFRATPVTGGTVYKIERSDLDGSNRTLVMAGTTTFTPTGPLMLIGASYGSQFLRLDRLDMAHVLYDDFHRADASPATPSPQGFAYSHPFGNPAQISSNRLTGSANDWMALTNIGGPAGDFDWTYEFVTGTPPAGPTDHIDLYFRLQDSSNYCFVELAASNLGMYAVVGGTLTPVSAVSQSVYTGTAGQAHSLRVQGVGNTITASLDGVPRITATVTALTTAAGTGVHQYAPSGYGTLLFSA